MNPNAWEETKGARLGRQGREVMSRTEGSRKRQSALVPAHLQGGVIERLDGMSHVQMSSTRAAARAWADSVSYHSLSPSDMCCVDLCEEGPEMPRLRVLTSQENGPDLSYRKWRKFYFPTGVYDKDYFLHTCEAPGTGPGPENTGSLCPATVLREGWPWAGTGTGQRPVPVSQCPSPASSPCVCQAGLCLQSWIYL